MDNNNIDSELNDDFIYKIIKMISELYDAENFLNYIIKNNKFKKTESFVIFDKAWLEKWKIIVGYEELKEKCFKCKSDEEKKKLIGEVRELFIKLNTKEKLDELGMMNSDNLNKIIGKKKFLNEQSNFLPVLAHQCAYFMKSINSPITINSEISNGIIYIQNPFPEKNKEQKLILLNKNENSNDFIRHVITLEPNVKVKDVVKELKKKNINEIMNQKEFKLELIKPIVITESKESEYKRKEAEYKRKEAEWKRKEAEWKRKEAEWKREEAEWKREETKWKREETEWKRKDPEWKRKEEERKRKEAERKRKEEEEEREKKEAERKRKEAEEAERKRKEEEEERKKKEAEDLKKRKELQEKLKKEEEERKRKEEEEKKQKELQEKLKKEEEVKKQKELQEKLKKEEEDKKKKEEEEEEEERRKKQIQDEMKKNEVDEKIRKERERPVNKKFENEKIKNNLADAIKKQIVFDENIKKKGEIQDENFLIRCSVVNKDWYEKFLKLSNYDSIKENLLKFNNNVDQAIYNTLNDKDFKIEEIKNFVKNKPQLITDKGLENIENLAFVDDEFAAKVLSLGENNDNNNIYSNVDNQNKNVINKNQILPKSHTKIMINNGSAIIQLSNQKYVCANINDSNLNKRDNIEVIDFFENKNFDLFKEIKSNPKVGLRQAVKEKYISNIRPKEGKKIELNVIRQKEEKKEKERLEKEDKEQREKEEREKKERDEKEKRERINLDNRDYSLGLDNVGATCFMNATLQCLAHIKRITEYVLNYRRLGKLKDTKQYRLSDAYSEVLWEIWLPQDKSKKSFSPNRFKEVLGQMILLFAPTAVNDAKDLLIFFIEQMHTELNQTIETNTNLVMPDNMNPMNHQEVLECFIREFTKKYKSVFSNYFYGSNVSITFCNGCRISKYSYQFFSCINLVLLESKKNCVTSGKVHPKYYNNYILNIEDCFIYNQKLEFFTGDNQMYCNICQASKDSSMQTRISAAPLVLILILNRGRGNLDFREPFTFWEIIDLTNYVEFPQPDNKYFLSGVVSYMGESGPSGHYIAYCRMSPNSKYYCYNDSLVNESSFEEINRRGTPYILFYQKCVIVA